MFMIFLLVRKEIVKWPAANHPILAGMVRAGSYPLLDRGQSP
jgi:hypothetical protein